MDDIEFIKYWLIVLTSLVIFFIIHTGDDEDKKDKDKED